MNILRMKIKSKAENLKSPPSRKKLEKDLQMSIPI